MNTNTPADEECEEPEGCPGSQYGGVSPRDPAFDDNHNLDDSGRCRQCHKQITPERDPEDGRRFEGSFQAG